MAIEVERPYEEIRAENLRKALECLDRQIAASDVWWRRNRLRNLRRQRKAELMELESILDQEEGE